MLSGTNSLRNTHRSTFLRKLPGGVRQLVAVWVSAKHPPRQTEWTPFEKLSSTGRDKISTGTPNNFEQFYLETYSHGHKGGIINDEEILDVVNADDTLPELKRTTLWKVLKKLGFKWEKTLYQS
ncbi:hypothetical protein QE152_g15524 [Popillia japonica]|uniref:Uncharacterized protein n=1 Tax=Popillia japonica TaxID=7064 RepID=A0AAW1L9D2_POPJA